jgi:hypothetical protein
MRFTMRVAAISLCLLLAVAFVRAQAQTKSSNDQSAVQPLSHLRVDLVLTEYNGDKKIGSLPYALYVGAPDREHGPGAPSAFLRMGVRVPIATGPTTGANTQYQYENIGTNIDVDATSLGDHLYRLQCTVERTAVSSPNEAVKLAVQQTLPTLPILSNFNSRFELSLHDGESGEAMSATDPSNGHVMKVDVTIHVLK